MSHITRCLSELRRRGAATFEPKERAQKEFVAQMRARAPSTVFAHGNCAPSNSYYFNQHGEASLLRLSPTALALHRASHFPLEDYDFGTPQGRGSTASEARVTDAGR